MITPLFAVAAALAQLGAQPLRHLLGEVDRVHHAEVERLGVLAGDREEAHRLLVLPVVEEELGAVGRATAGFRGVK